MKLKHTVCLLVLAVTLFSCSNPSRTAAFEIGDTFYKEVYLIRGKQFTKRLVSSGKVESQYRTNLSEQQLAAFWKTMQDERVAEWNDVYLPSSKTNRTATTGWAITLQSVDGMTQSGGGGAFPSDVDLSKSVGPDFSARFERIVLAFDSLLE